jgi:hypothetical protein
MKAEMAKERAVSFLLLTHVTLESILNEYFFG